MVAIKKVLQDKRFKNRELQIMKQLVKLPHPNIVLLKQCFYSNGEKPEELYLNLVSGERRREMIDVSEADDAIHNHDRCWSTYQKQYIQ